MYNKEQLIEDLKKIGIKRGMKLMIHSSYKRLGEVLGGPKTVIEAIKELVSEEGVIMMPSFNHRVFYDENRDFIFDINKTPTTNGIIPQTFIESKNIFRSHNPTHSFAVWGKDARKYVENHHKLLTMGENSPLDLMMKNGGYVLLMGVNYDRNTLHHVAEQKSHVSCLGYRIDSIPIRINNKVVNGRTWAYKNGECPLIVDNVYGTLMEKHKLHIKSNIGEAESVFFKMEDCFNLVCNLIKNGYKKIPSCSNCSIKPQIKPGISTISDWDFNHNCLKSNSELIDVEY